MENRQVKRIAINGFLIAIFISSIVIISALFLAEAQFTAAKRVAAAFFVQEAVPKFEKAINIDPFNSRFLARYASILKHIGSLQVDKIAELAKAKKLYEQALALNPYHAEYALGMGQVRLSIFMWKKNKLKFVENKVYIEEAFQSFNEAIRNDPNGFNVSYSVGYSGMTIWNYLNDFEKELILTKLKQAVKLRPGYSKYIYAHIWKMTKDFKLLQRVTPESLEANKILLSFIQGNSLYQFRKEQVNVVNFYRQKEGPALFMKEKKEWLDKIEYIKRRTNHNLENTLIPRKGWSGQSKNGKNIYKNGDMYWTGRMDAAVLVPKGDAIINIQAKGTPTDGVWPYMVVELDGKEISEMFVDNTEWKEYSFNINTDGGLKVVSISFLNDGGNAEKNEDRNLYIGEAWIEK